MDNDILEVQCHRFLSYLVWMPPYRDICRRTDGMFYCNTRKQTCHKVVLLVCYYPSIGDYRIATNWLLVYQVWENVIFVYCNHWASATCILSGSVVIFSWIRSIEFNNLMIHNYFLSNNHFRCHYTSLPHCEPIQYFPSPDTVVSHGQTPFFSYSLGGKKRVWSSTLTRSEDLVCYC